MVNEIPHHDAIQSRESAESAETVSSPESTLPPTSDLVLPYQSRAADRERVAGSTDEANGDDRADDGDQQIVEDQVQAIGEHERPHNLMENNSVTLADLRSTHRELIANIDRPGLDPQPGVAEVDSNDPSRERFARPDPEHSDHSSNEPTEARATDIVEPEPANSTSGIVDTDLLTETQSALEGGPHHENRGHEGEPGPALASMEDVAHKNAAGETDARADSTVMNEGRAAEGIDSGSPADASDTSGRREGADSQDQRHDVVEPQVTTDYGPGVPPSVTDRYMVRDPERPIPLFAGPPTREQAAQGQIGDCGVIATLGAVAGQRPEAIQNAIRQTGDGEFEITLHQISPATVKDLVARPTGHVITYRVTDELPVSANQEAATPVGARVETCGWAALLEKAVAAQDQAWGAEQQAAWEARWRSGKKAEVDEERIKCGLDVAPSEPPTGYNRLDTGSSPLHRANLLAELTGLEAVARKMPNEQDGEQALLDEFQLLLDENKPILVGSRSERFPGEPMPFAREVFSFSHAFEVVQVDEGKIQVRNPWGSSDGVSTDPPPMDVRTFWEYFRRYGPSGDRTDGYSTLK